jgi:hypothetical protein
VQRLGERPGMRREAGMIAGELHGLRSEALGQRDSGSVGQLPRDASPTPTTIRVEPARSVAISGM